MAKSENEMKRETGKRDKNGKPKVGCVILSLFLSFTLVIELIFIGFVKPGVFVKHEHISYRSGRNNGEQGGNSYVASLEESPGNPAGISIRFTQKEIDNAPSFEATVTHQELSVQAGEVSATLSPWMIEEEDTFVVKELPVKQDGDGNDMYAYDLSLSSGTHDLITCAELVIPRKAGDKDGKVVWYNPEEDCWEPTYYEISDDGNSYVIKTTHFSIFGEMLDKMGIRYGKNENELAGSLFSKVYDGESQLHLERVRLNDGAIENLVKVPVDESLVNQIKLIPGSETTIPEDTAVTEFINGLNRFALGYGVTAVNQVKNYITNVGVLKKIGYTGVAFVLIRVVYQIWNGGSLGDVLYANRGDIAGAVVGVGSTATGLLGAEGAAACGWVGLAIFVYFESKALREADDTAIESYGPDSIYEAVGSWYNDRHAEYKGQKIYMGTFNSKTTTFLMTFSAWPKVLDGIFTRNLNNPNAIHTELDELYQAYSTPFYSLSNEEKYAYFTKVLSDNAERNNLLNSDLVRKLGRDAIGKEELEAFENGDASAFSQEKMVEAFSKTNESVCKRKAYAMAVYWTKPLLQSLSEAYYVKSVEEFKKYLYAETLPLMNKTVMISAVDTAEGINSFDESAYAGSKEQQKQFTKQAPYSLVGEKAALYDKSKLAMYFMDVKEPIFYPSNLEDKSQYAENAFVPHASAGSSEIFQCRMYDYLAVGAPANVFFKGDETNPPLTETVTFEPSFDSNVITGTVTLKSNVSDQYIVLDETVPILDYHVINLDVKGSSGHADPEARFTLDRDGMWSITVPQQVYKEKNGNGTYTIQQLEVGGMIDDTEIENYNEDGMYGMDPEKRVLARVGRVECDQSYHYEDIGTENGYQYISTKDAVTKCDNLSDQTYLRIEPYRLDNGKTGLSICLALCPESGRTSYRSYSERYQYDNKGESEIGNLSGNRTYAIFRVETDLDFETFQWKK